MEVAQARAALADYVRDVNQEPVIVADHGRPVAALVAIEDTDMETASLSTNPAFIALIERSRSRQQAEGGISSEEMRRELGLPG